MHYRALWEKRKDSRMKRVKSADGTDGLLPQDSSRKGILGQIWKTVTSISLTLWAKSAAAERNSHTKPYLAAPQSSRNR